MVQYLKYPSGTCHRKCMIKGGGQIKINQGGPEDRSANHSIGVVVFLGMNDKDGCSSDGQHGTHPMAHAVGNFFADRLNAVFFCGFQCLKEKILATKSQS